MWVAFIIRYLVYQAGVITLCNKIFVAHSTCVMLYSVVGHLVPSKSGFAGDWFVVAIITGFFFTFMLYTTQVTLV